MSLRIAFQMDPIKKVDVNADTTFRLIEEAQRRGHSSYVYEPESLRSDRGEIIATASSVRVDRNIKEFAPTKTGHQGEDIFRLAAINQELNHDWAYGINEHDQNGVRNPQHQDKNVGR